MQKNIEERLKGRVNTYSEAVQSGVLVTTDNQTYLFSRHEWLSELSPFENIDVTFIASQNWAKSIMVLSDAEEQRLA